MNYEKELNFFCRLAESSRIKTHIVDKTTESYDIDSGLRYSLGLLEDYDETFKARLPHGNTIIKLKDVFESKYFLVPLPNNDSHCKVLVVGPYMTDLISKEDVEKKAVFYSLSPSAIKNIQKYYSIVPYVLDDTFITLAINCLGEALYENVFNVETRQRDDVGDISALVTSKAVEESDSPLFSIELIEKAYEQENKLLDAISQGLVHKAETFFSTGKPSDMLETRVTDKLRNAKNFLIVLNTLARKAVEQGGVHPIYIDRLSSDFAMKIEACKSTNECDELFYSLVRKYARLVQKHSNKGYSLPVQKVITCIDTDITSDLTLKTLASILNVNPSYLSTLFKKETGVTLTEYVNKKRVEKAKQLLKMGNVQIQTVAQSCGMLDVNYFTKIFKKHTGVTPREYRER